MLGRHSAKRSLWATKQTRSVLEILCWDLLEGDLADEPAEFSWACPFPQGWAPEFLCLLVSDHALLLGFTTKGRGSIWVITWLTLSSWPLGSTTRSSLLFRRSSASYCFWFLQDHLSFSHASHMASLNLSNYSIHTMSLVPGQDDSLIYLKLHSTRLCDNTEES